MDELTGSVLAGVLTAVIVDTGRWIGRRLRTVTGKRQVRDIGIAKWFDTYELSESAPTFGSAVDADSLHDVLRSNDLHAVVHELLAVRLSDAPESDAVRLRESTRIVFGHAELSVALADDVFGYFDQQICALVVRLGAEQPDLLRDIRSDAHLTRINATVSAIERHLSALSRRADPAADEEFLRRYRRHVVDHHGKLEPPDFQRRRRVPIDALYVPQTFSFREASDPDHQRRLDIWTLEKELDRTVVLGDPGGGKTTTTNVLVHAYARDVAGRVPFLVTVREFASEDPPARSVVGHIEHKLSTFYQCQPPEGLVERLLLGGRALVVFDGLDELIDTGRRADVTARVERFGTEFPLTAVLVTSRTIGYDQARLDDSQFRSYMLAGFDGNGVAEYVRKWFAQDDGFVGDEAGRAAEDFLSASADVPDLRTNPLLLSLMCILYRGEGSIPHNRPMVYEECAKLLFQRWDTRRRIHVELRARNLVEPALRHLAYWLFTRDNAEPLVARRELTERCAEYFLERGFEQRADAEAAAEEFVEFCTGRAWVFTDAGTMRHGEELYTFTHRTFLEYFAAVQLASMHDTPEQLASSLVPRIAQQEWEAVSQLALQVKDRTSDRGAERFYRSLLSDRQLRQDEETEANVLAFLCRSLRILTMPANLVRDLTVRTMELVELESGGLSSVGLRVLSHLLTCCADKADIVRSELSAIFDRFSASEDSVTRDNMLRLATDIRNVPAILILHAGSSTLFWQQFGAANCVRYAGQLMAAAPNSDDFAVQMFYEGRAGMDELLSWHGSGVLWLEGDFLGFPRFVPVGAELLMGNSDWHIQKLIEFLEVVEDRGFPPMFSFYDLPEWEATLSNHVRSDPPETQRLRSGHALAATGILLFVYDEISAEEDLLSVLPEYPHLEVFTPYLQWRRWNFVELFDLDLPEKYQDLFLAWANREIDFVR